MNDRGTILIITLWIITLLSAIALSLTYRMGMELKISSSRMNSEKAFCIAKAGVVQAISVLNQESSGYECLNQQWSNYDSTLYGVNLFKDVIVGDGKFNISYVFSQDIFTGGQQVFYGMIDEERKININKATKDVLESLPGMTPDITASIRAWRGDTDIPQDILFKDDSYYQGLPKPYKRKGKPFEHLEELILVKGVTPELIYGKDLNGDGVITFNELGIIRYLTVYGDGLININTADITVFRAIGFSEDLSYRILRFRSGYDEMIGTEDDGVFTDVNRIADILQNYEPLMPDEQVMINNRKSLLKVSSRYYTAYVEGEIPNAAKCKVSAVIDKEASEENQIVRWDE